MADGAARSIAEMIDDDNLMTEAIRQGVRDELLAQARAGNSVHRFSENGQGRLAAAGRNLSPTWLLRAFRRQSVVTHLSVRYRLRRLSNCSALPIHAARRLGPGARHRSRPRPPAAAAGDRSGSAATSKHLSGNGRYHRTKMPP